MGTQPYNPWPRGVAWLLVLGPLFFLSYGWANHLAAADGVTRSLHAAWEHHIPFWPWTIVPYWSIDLLYGLSFLACRSAAETTRHALRLLTVQLIAVGCFALWPLRFGFERPTVDGPFGTLFTALAQFDLPYNQAPSLHIALLVVIWQAFSRWRTGWLRRGMIDGWALLIALSVLTTWQHHLIDVPTGAALGWLAVWCWPQPAQPSPLRRALPTGITAAAAMARRHTLAGVYAAGALALLGLAVTVGGLGWVGLWPALSLALVAWHCGHSGAAGFQKNADGQLSRATQVLLLPYRAGAWLNAWWWTRHQPSAVPIADGVWLGQMPFSTAALQRHGWTTLVDLCAELPAPRATATVQRVTLPWLDLVPPAPEDLNTAAQAIEAARLHGPVGVVCALGCGRSAAAVARWLRLTDRATSVADAVAQVQRTRPCAVFSQNTLAALHAAEDLADTAVVGALAPTPAQAAAQTALTAAWLDTGHTLHTVSLGLGLATAVWALQAPSLHTDAHALALVLAAGLAGLVQGYHALRTRLDARVFAHWAGTWAAAGVHADPAADLRAFDGARSSHSPSLAPRTLAERRAGALHLLAWQALSLWVQAALVGALWLH